ncbi:hypothetical protein EDB83DRAFT_1386545 [Lactarius deliciosus]|nr:hypothetical protein EDB83DRAFT_1386545 [Lactarius deliciosus]
MMFANIQAYLRGNTAAAGSTHDADETLLPGPQPVPENLCELRNIVADISHAANRSPFVQAQTKKKLSDLRGRLDAECSQIVTLTRLAHRAASESANVLLSRIRFFEALDDRIRQISALRERFVDSRKTFREKPTKLLAGSIRDAKGHTHEGMFSDLKPLFDQIDEYYKEVNVSLLAEERRLNAIRRSLRVTPDDRLRWEHIRDACREASRLLAVDESHTHPHHSSSFAPTDRPPPPSVPFTGAPQQQPPPINNKAASNMRALAQTVAAARDRLRQTHANIAPLTHHPQTDLLRLMSEYENGEKTCRQRVAEVLEFSERFIHSFAEVPALDDFRDHLLPAAAASSSHVLREVAADVRNTMPAVQNSLPRPADHFVRFERCLPMADGSTQNLYQSLHGLVLPLERPEDPKQGVLRPLTRVQLREEQRTWRGLEEQWANQL